jgi:immunoglobulin-binding protein 1
MTTGLDQLSMKEALGEVLRIRERADGGTATEGDVARGLELCGALDAEVGRRALFSLRTEELEDIPTASLPLLLVPYAWACIALQRRTASPAARLELLTATAARLRTFVADTARLLRITVPSSEDGDEPKRDPASARAEKVAAFRRKREAAAALEEARARAKRGVPEDEEVQREVSLALVRVSVLDAVEQLRMTEREAAMLGEVERMRGEGTLDQAMRAERERKEAAAAAPRKPPVTILPNAAAKRAEFREGVFRPGYSVATYMPEDVPALDPGECATAATTSGSGKRRGPHGERLDSESDDSDKETDDSLRKARQWDDWKDENPRGSGNTKGQG